MNHLKLLGTVVLALAACAAPDDAVRRVTADEGRFSFALIGDMPYGEAQLRGVDAILADINADRSVRFVMHAGDIKGGGERCDDGLIEARFRQLQQIERALIYTPGDNEWTDCHRANNGGYLPTERLAFLRRLFFAHPSLSTGKRPLPVLPQSTMPGHEPFVENVMFEHAQMVFATVHVVGSNNDLVPWNGIDPADSAAAPRADRRAEFEAREAAALAWIDRTFDEAHSRRAAGVFLLMQANPGIEHKPDSPQRAGFEPLLAKLKARALAFGKPVVLAHGDFHELLIDMPLYRDAEPAPKVPRFTRIQGFGSPRLHWVKIVVDSHSDAVFRFEPQLVAANR